MEQIVKVMKVDVISESSGVTYPREVIIQSLEAFKQRLVENNEAIPGESGVPYLEDETDIKPRMTSLLLSRVSHVVKAIWMDGDTVFAKIALLEKYAELANMGVEFSVIPRILGVIDENNVCKSCTLVTLDLAYVGS